MRIALIGATGNAGSRILAELLNRGHEITAVVRRPENVSVHPKLKAVGTDGSRESLTIAVKSHDAVVSSVRFLDLDPDILLPAIQDSGVKRYVVVGGAGSLLHPDGMEEARRPEFPEKARPNSLRGGDFLNMLRATNDLDWTYISPSRSFVAGARTGVFRYGSDHMLMDAAGKPTSISFEDFAIAVAHELENPHYVRQRFTIGY